MRNIPKRYEPDKYEEKWASRWTKDKTFKSVPDKRRPYSIVIPPPNVTGVLHMGHALNNVIQDIVIRYHKIIGRNVMWMPGTDHGGIATQNVVEKMLLEEGKTRHDLGREKFLERMWKWKDESGGKIIKQLKRLGCGCDWDRIRFTMDEKCSDAVKEAFIKLFNKGLIYRGEYMINWCPRCSTALSDIEVEYEERDTKLWHIKYPVKGTGEGYVVVATTRPETMLGDTAVAVNPNDERYKKLIGKKALLPVVNREIEIISDDMVDTEFGTGAVKVTPGHDPNDFDMGNRHGLDIIKVIDEDAKMTKEAGRYANMDRYECRKELVKHLKKENFISEIEDYRHSVGSCYRCQTVIEPILSKQWFLKMRSLADKALEVSRKKEIEFVPESWEKPYINWLENIHDWCISRQIWWGHRIPVYYCESEDCPPVADYKKPQVCPHCKNGQMKQDEDVLDTWFSSGLWPFSTLGWPSENEDIEYYYPTDVLVTGHEILYLWVARMVMMGLEMMDKKPFRYVNIHGMIRDEKGNKMSKSKGNVIDPIDIIDKYGTDALRFSLAKSAVPGRDIHLSEEDFKGSRNFCNKLWNATRLILSNIEIDNLEGLKKEDMELADKWILYELERFIRQIKESYENFNNARATRLIYEFSWNYFCDWYLEIVKLRFYGDRPGKKTAEKTVLKVLLKILNIIHPVMPFISSQLWEYISQEVNLETSNPLEFNGFEKMDIDIKKSEGERMRVLIEIVSGIRNIRGEAGLAPSVKMKATVKASGEKKKLIEEYEDYVKTLAVLESLNVDSKAERKGSDSVAVASGMTVFVSLPEELRKQEINRLEKKIEKIQGKAINANKKLSNREFVEKAPDEVVNRARKRAGRLSEELDKLRKSLKEKK